MRSELWHWLEAGLVVKETELCSAVDNIRETADSGAGSLNACEAFKATKTTLEPGMVGGARKFRETTKDAERPDDQCERDEKPRQRETADSGAGSLNACEAFKATKTTLEPVSSRTQGDRTASDRRPNNPPGAELYEQVAQRSARAGMTDEAPNPHRGLRRDW
ncbi:hypothetical protein C8J56DRAFT_887527 [Mycena floridula]|nr:hypothetical protein C8J56DRAFT_887527 [Mycena floridula]